MGLIENASRNSLWRGIDYYERKKVISWETASETSYVGKVSGSGDTIYDVIADKAHPRKSKCTCPFADGRRVICKHMLAVYFTAEPEEVDRINQMIEEEEEEEQERYEEESAYIWDYVNSLSPSELRLALYNELMSDFSDDRW